MLTYSISNLSVFITKSEVAYPLYISGLSDKSLKFLCERMGVNSLKDQLRLSEDLLLNSDLNSCFLEDLTLAFLSQSELVYINFLYYSFELFLS